MLTECVFALHEKRLPIRVPRNRDRFMPMVDGVDIPVV
jgi:hypothetical protein